MEQLLPAPCLPRAAVRPFLPFAVQHAPHFIEMADELVLVDRLQQIAVDLQADRLLGVVEVRVAAQDEHVHGIARLPDRLDELQARHARHPYVHDQQIRAVNGDFAQRVLAVRGRIDHRVAQRFPIDQRPQSFADRRFIIGNQHVIHG